MKNEELIKALRWCGSDDEQHEMCVDESYSCPMWNEDRMTDYCKADLMLATADALEVAEKRIAGLEAQLQKDAVEVVHGEWMRYGEDGNPNSIDTCIWQCDKCLETYYGRTERIPNYCPNCGAKMDGEVKDP